MPDPDPVLEISDINAAQKLWNSALSEKQLNVSLDMSSVICCIDCKAKFTQDKYYVDQNVLIEVYIR